MNYIGKTTAELSEKEFTELSALFNHVFNKSITPLFLKHKYVSPFSGFSYHGLMYNDAGSIVGALTFIPFSYQFFNTPVVAGCAADLMIHEQYRKDLLSFKRMYDLAISKSGNLLDFVYAVPNSNAYLYWIKILKWQDIGQLNYYVQVLNISKIISRIVMFDWLSRIFSSCLNVLFFDNANRSVDHKYSIYKLCNNSYNKYRFEGKYLEIIQSDKFAYYSIVEEMGIRTVYLIDLYPLSKSWMGRVVKLINAKEKKHIDIIIYVGNDIKSPINLLKVPRKFEPRILHLIGKCLTDKVDNRIFNLANWRFNLSDFDVR